MEEKLDPKILENIRSVFEAKADKDMIELLKQKNNLLEELVSKFKHDLEHAHQAWRQDVENCRQKIFECQTVIDLQREEIQELEILLGECDLDEDVFMDAEEQISKIKHKIH